MTLQLFVNSVTAFDNLSHREKIALFAWYSHTYKGMAVVDSTSIRGCYKELHLTPPNISLYLSRIASSQASDLIKERGGYKLERATRSRLDAKYGVHESRVNVSKILSDLPTLVVDNAEKVFLVEALSCYRVEAYRSCIVMTWNLAFTHLIQWILVDSQRLADFSASISKRFPKRGAVTVASQADFEDFKEFEIIELCQTASLCSKNLIEILREKLKRRNIAAHPSRVIVTRSQADDVITDLVNNIVVALV